jgi:DNA-binding NarL/FixJ family response regulator
MIRIFCVGTRRLPCDDIANMLNTAHDLVWVGSSSPRKAATRCAELKPDIVLLSLFAPDPDNLRAARTIISKNPLTRIVVLSRSTEPDHAHTMLKVGVSGYLLAASDLADLPISIRAVHSGNVVCSQAIAHVLIQSNPGLEQDLST